MIVYDVSNRSSFESVQKWVDDVRDHHHKDEIIIAILANKVDIDSREVSPE